MTADEDSSPEEQESDVSDHELACELALQHLGRYEADLEKAFYEARSRLRSGESIEEVIGDLMADVNVVVVGLGDMMRAAGGTVSVDESDLPNDE